MSTFVLTRPDVFPAGQQVDLYTTLNPATQQPLGPLNQSKTVQSNGSVTFTSLNDGARYYAYAPAPDRVISFQTDPAPVTGGSIAVEADPLAVKLVPSAGQTIAPNADVPALTLKTYTGAAQGSSMLELRDAASADALRLSVAKEGTLTSRRSNVFFPNVQAYANATDAQPQWSINGNIMAFGPGGATTQDTRVQRATYTSPLTGASLLSLDYSNTADATQPLLLTSTGIRVTKPSGLWTHDATPLEVRSVFDSNAAVPQANIRAQADYRGTTGGARTVYSRGIESYNVFGTPTIQASGTGHAFTATVIIQRSNADSEHACYFGMLRYDSDLGSTQGGRAWLTDWAVHGAPDVQQQLLSGVNVVLNNRFNGSPSQSPSYAFAALTANGAGGGWDGKGTVHASDVGFWVGGQSQDANGLGFYVGFKVGHGTHPRTGSTLTNAFGWNFGASTVGKGMQLDDFTTHGVHVNSRRGTAAVAVKTEVAAGPSQFLGGLQVPVKAGIPVDADFAPVTDGLVVGDTSNNRLYIRLGGTWKFASLT